MLGHVPAIRACRRDVDFVRRPSRDVDIDRIGKADPYSGTLSARDNDGA